MNSPEFFPKPKIEKLSFQTVAETLYKNNPDIDDLIISIGSWIRKETEGGEKPKSIIESRLTSAEEALEKKLSSCGTLTTIFAAMLRHVGLEVKLIHGECKESVDHAWISVLNPETNQWKEYDVGRKDYKVPETNIEKMKVNSWEEIKDQLINDHKTLNQRKRNKFKSL